MDQDQMHKEVALYVAPLLNAVERWVEFMAGQVNESQSTAQAVAEQPSIHPFAEEVGEAVATLSQNFFDFSETMRNIYARQRGDAQRDYVPTRDDLVFQLFERWRRTDGHQGNGPRQREQIIAELEVLFAPASDDPEIERVFSDIGLSPVHENWIYLDRDIADILRVALPREDQSMQIFTVARLVMGKIEQYLQKSK